MRTKLVRESRPQGSDLCVLDFMKYVVILGQMGGNTDFSNEELAIVPITREGTIRNVCI